MPDCRIIDGSASPMSPRFGRGACEHISVKRATDEDGKRWEVVTRPWTTNAGKLVHASVQKPGDPSTKRDKTWGAHERLAIRRT
jgi:hypothetical protein